MPYVSLGMDGTMILISHDGYRETMVGTIAFYDHQGQREHLIYVAGSPEYRKSKFIKNFEEETGKIKSTYPNAKYVGIADGTHTN